MTLATPPLRDNVAMAMESLRAQPVRGALTTSGLVFGVAAIITMAGMGIGLQNRLNENFGQLASQIQVTKIRGTQAQSGTVRHDLTDSDAAASRPILRAPDRRGDPGRLRL